MKSIHALLQNAIDYAGLFPPAGLPMFEAVANYARYRAGDDAWALGRFVVPAARLAEFESVACDRLPRDGEPWRLSALGGEDLTAGLDAIRAFNDRHRPDSDNGAATIDTIEVKAASVADVERITMIIGKDFDTYVETPLSADLPRLIEAIRAAGLRAKIRTGGVTADAIPAPEDVLRFMALCVAAGVPFKATAGLHHPLRSIYRLTYAPDAPSATMHGFLNVFVAAALLRAGVPAAEALDALRESSPDAFQFDADGICWRDHRLSREAIHDSRHHGLIAFGSCSFDEPIHDLKALRLL